MKKVIIIGGVAGGATAAARIRRLNEEAKIILIERGEYISFANCGLPYHVGNIIKDREKLLVAKPEMMIDRYNIDLRLKTEAQKINREKKTVTLHDLTNNNTYEESYDAIILSPGAAPIRPQMPGINNSNIFVLRNMPDMDAIIAYTHKKPVHATIVGGGYVGLEVAENFVNLGVKVTIVELLNQVMSPLDYEMATIVHQHLKNKGVELYLEEAVQGFEDSNGITNVILKSGKKIPTNMVLLGIGVKPEVQLAKDAALELGERGGIKVNEYLQTSDPNIYAVGDAIEVIDFINQKPSLIPLAGPANKQGRIAANNIFGAGEKYLGTQGTSILLLFDLQIATTGNNEKTLKRNNIPYIKSFTHSASHAGYYPGSSPMSIELLFSPKEGKVLGAQIVGFDGVDKRIDVIATAIRAQMTVADLEFLELAYAPPFSSAKDPVNIAGYVANNILKGDMKIIHWNEIKSLDPNRYFILDVRTKTENSLGAISNAHLVPINELRKRLSEIPKDKKIVVYCQVGLRAYIGTRILKQNGYDVYNLSGGYTTYKTIMEEQTNEGIFGDLRILSSDEMRGTYSQKTGEKALSEGKSIKSNMEIDATGLQCPGPLLKLAEGMKQANAGEVVKIRASDPGFVSDVKVWAEKTNNQLLSIHQIDKEIVANLKKGIETQTKGSVGVYPNAKTMVVFSGDLDKAIAAFIIANGAASMGRKMTMFFTFWGLNILRRDNKVNVNKTMVEKMFGKMMPRGAKKLSLSKMNMFGIGKSMIKGIMKKKNILSLPELIDSAKKAGVRLIGCQMTMDLMGIKKDELIDGVEIGGVATFLGSADESNMTLFV